MRNKYSINEITKIASLKLSLKKVNGKFGIIRGFSQNKNDSMAFGYAVDVLNDTGTVEATWFIFEEDLHPTGTVADPNLYLLDESLKLTKYD